MSTFLRHCAIAGLAILLLAPVTSWALEPVTPSQNEKPVPPPPNAGQPQSFGHKVGSTAREVKEEVKETVQQSKKWVKDQAHEVKRTTKEVVREVKEGTVKAVHDAKRATKEAVGEVKKGFNGQ